MRNLKTLEERRKELVGRTFGKLTVKDVQPNVIESTGKRDGYIAICLCSCGREKIVKINKLLSNHTKSFGMCPRDYLVYSKKVYTKYKKEFVGKTFGKLTVIDIKQCYTSNGKKHGYEAMCICECGNTITVSTHDLSTGHTKSCGCFKGHYASESIIKWRNSHPEESNSFVKKLREWHKNNTEKSLEISCKNLKKAEQWKREHPKECEAILKKAQEKAKTWRIDKPQKYKEALEKTKKYWKNHRDEMIKIRRKMLLSRTSKEENDVLCFLESLGYDVERQFYLMNHFYDFRIGNFLIEYHGSSYHYAKYECLKKPEVGEPSNPKPIEYHLNLRDIAIQNGFNIIQIWDYNWINKKDFVQNLLREQLSGNANYKDYLEEGLLNNDYGFIIDGEQIPPKGIWISTKFRKVVKESFERGKTLVYNSGYTKVFKDET